MKKLNPALKAKLDESWQVRMIRLAEFDQLDLPPGDFNGPPPTNNFEIITLTNIGRRDKLPANMLGNWQFTGKNLDGTYRLQRYK